MHKLKSIRNALDYQKKKVAKTQLQVNTLQDNLSLAAESYDTLQAINSQHVNEVTQLKATVEKVSMKLSDRTQRFSNSRLRMEQEIRKLKSQAARRISSLEKKYTTDLNKEQAHASKTIEALQKKHSKVVAQEKSICYRLEMSHTKTVVAHEETTMKLEAARE